MKKIYYLLIMVSLALASCNKYLDLKPEDKFTEDDLYSTEAGFNNALNGIYLALADNNLYGANLTLTTVEVLAQRYNVSGDHNFTSFATYAYGQSDVMARFDGIWTSAYKQILNINKLLEALDKHKGILSKEKEDLIRGECMGLRAMMHFDLLRLFGPVYATGKDKNAIPYHKTTTAAPQPIRSAAAVADTVLSELTAAQQYLAADPVTTEGIQDFKSDGRDWFRRRNIRFNYFAAKALQARVLLYTGNKPAALAAAQDVITNATKWFPWVKPTDINSEPVNPDRICSTEIFFALYNPNLYNNQRDYFAAPLQPAAILAPVQSKLTAVYEGLEGDYRYKSSWILPSVGGKTYRTFVKYEDVQDTRKLFRFLQPLVRMSEMYYIAAECTTDATAALQYLNTVRFARGLVNLAATANITTEIGKEYKKEFFGEGQLFFYYKRMMTPKVINGAASAADIAPNYVLPLPLSETNQRTN
ncbi:RagB/SusD family nutrient uptake outer membrane protein [Chitinophaga varians]|uniref:RagB/SusD family nutrient uptake outer membrane protein n=1 Tax=Chitinophaga varians TaxID=2202339 RepID=UPI00165F7034|nr:RagB/SusD family nutrient uptake outer membrane protein [Chitinophaga varians]MBC9911648.1 RagB/SusD family nutrient uptake outer membrane protein [Chitinophaga varians]